MYEIKEGPYNPDTDKKFANWAPEEYTDESKIYLDKLKKALRN